MSAVRVIVTGSRHWPCHELAERIVTRLLARHSASVLVVHGDAPGVDTAFREACEEVGVDHEPHPARWDDLGTPGARVKRRRDGTPYNANAGPIRNAEMVSLGASFGIAAHKDLPASAGTGDCVARMLAAGLDVYLIDDEDGEPRKIRADWKRGEPIEKG